MKAAGGIRKGGRKQQYRKAVKKETLRFLNWCFMQLSYWIYSKSTRLVTSSYYTKNVTLRKINVFKVKTGLFDYSDYKNYI
jgi:hypothetical protein